MLETVPASQNSAVVVRGGDGLLIADIELSLQSLPCELAVVGLRAHRGNGSLSSRESANGVGRTQSTPNSADVDGRNRERTGDARPVPVRFSRYHATSVNAGVARGEYLDPRWLPLFVSGIARLSAAGAYEAIASDKCHMGRGPTINSAADGSFSGIADIRRSGSTLLFQVHASYSHKTRSSL